MDPFGETSSMNSIVTLSAIGFVALALLLPEVGSGQPLEPPRKDRPWQVGPHIVISVPQDDFENVSGAGGGLGIRAVREVTDWFQLRGDFAFVSFGKKVEEIGDDPDYGLFILEQDNQGARLTLGPQFSRTGESFGVYGYVEGGGYLFRTTVNARTAFGTFADTQDSNFALGWLGGLGVQFDVGLGPWIDLAVEHHTIFNLPGPIEPDPDDPTAPGMNGPDITARELTFKAGVNFFLE